MRFPSPLAASNAQGDDLPLPQTAQTCGSRQQRQHQGTHRDLKNGDPG